MNGIVAVREKEASNSFDTELVFKKVRKRIYYGIKRMIDIVFAVIGLVVASPIMLITALAIKLDSKGPALFKQERTGRFGKTFMLYKFRSMVVSNDVHDFNCADKHTKVGDFIRKTSIDELPQFINILKGDMSFIGPRPWITDYWENMNEEQRHRCDVLPGITGLAQAKGRNAITIFEKIGYDLEYVKNFGLMQDIKIVFLTIITVLSKKGADAGKGTISSELDALKNQNKELQDVDAILIAKSPVISTVR